MRQECDFFRTWNCPGIPIIYPYSDKAGGTCTAIVGDGLQPLQWSEVRLHSCVDNVRNGRILSSPTWSHPKSPLFFAATRGWIAFEILFVHVFFSSVWIFVVQWLLGSQDDGRFPVLFAHKGNKTARRGFELISIQHPLLKMSRLPQVSFPFHSKPFNGQFSLQRQWLIDWDTNNS